MGAQGIPRIAAKAGTWEELSPKRYREWMPGITSTSTGKAKLALHCDLLECSLGHHAPAFDLFGLARKITLVSIKPNIARLTAQYGSRESGTALGLLGSTKPPEAIWRTVNPKRDPASLTVVNPGELVERIADSRRRVLDVYRQPGWVDRLYAEWEQLAIRLSEGVPLRTLEIAPTGRFDWVLVRDSSAQNKPFRDLRAASGT